MQISLMYVNFYYNLVLEILLNFIIMELLFYVFWHVLHPMASFTQKDLWNK
jgi:hypothetical protein